MVPCNLEMRSIVGVLYGSNAQIASHSLYSTQSRKNMENMFGDPAPVGSQVVAGSNSRRSDHCAPGRLLK